MHLCIRLIRLDIDLKILRNLKFTMTDFYIRIKNYDKIYIF